MKIGSRSDYVETTSFFNMVAGSHLGFSQKVIIFIIFVLKIQIITVSIDYYNFEYHNDSLNLQYLFCHYVRIAGIQNGCQINAETQLPVLGK